MSRHIISTERLDRRRFVLTSIRRLQLPGSAIRLLEEADIFLVGDVLCLTQAQLRDLVGTVAAGEVSGILSGKTQIEVIIYSRDPRKFADTVWFQIPIALTLGMSLEAIEPDLTTKFYEGRRGSVEKSRGLPIR